MIFNKNIKPPENITLPEYSPKGMDAGYWILKRELDKGKDAKILVYYDPDIDGLFAGLLVEQYLEKLGVRGPNYKYFLNSDRQHGFKLTDNLLAQLKGYTIVAVDFSITKEEFDRILKAGINLVNIDHHEIDVHNYTNSDRDFVCSRYNDSYGVIINNQYACEPKEFKFLSGAGMVYYFLKYVSRYLHVSLDVDFPAMVGITLLSDIRELESKEARSFLRYTFSSDSEYMKYLQWLVTSELSAHQRFSPFGVPCISRDFIDFTFSPVINAMLRANKGYEALNLLRGNDEAIHYWRDNNTLLTFRDTQKKIISAIMREVDESENMPGSLTKKYDNMMVCCLPTTFEPIPGFNISNYIGVACSKIKDEDKTGVIFVVDANHIVKRGSVRGGQDGVDYLTIFQNNGVPSAGHHNAFGILPCDISKINFDKISKDIEIAEKEAMKNKRNTRSVFEVRQLDIFVKSPAIKKICKYNSLSRDNHRIYLKFIGDVEDTNRVKRAKYSDKFTRYMIDNVCVNCYDPSIDIKDALILPSLDNNKYVRCTLRPGFEYDSLGDMVEIQRKLSEI